MTEFSTNAVTFPNSTDHKLPLPLLIAQDLQFSLRTVERNGQLYYRLQDWLVGVVDEPFAIQKIRTLRRSYYFAAHADAVYLVHEQDAKKRTQAIEHVTDKLLYAITQDLRVTGKRRDTTAVLTIKDYLARAGAFTDRLRREPDKVFDLIGVDPDDALNAVIEAYRKRGKDDRWIAARLMGKIKRQRFLGALKAAVASYLSGRQYAAATDQIYQGLWRRTSAELKKEMELSARANLRDNQPFLALTYQGLAEEVAAQKLADRDRLSWYEALLIIRQVANLIGVQAAATSQFLKVDIATGKPLLTEGVKAGVA
ncbi:MAG: hypothetical protein KF716_21135 [Anaerolineae bacterium]|nr:hypothetical protein [Anaerolineae bacterium]